jgi:hypothetical protein
LQHLPWLASEPRADLGESVQLKVFLASLYRAVVRAVHSDVVRESLLAKPCCLAPLTEHLTEVLD